MISVFLLLISIEVALTFLRKKDYYCFSDSITSLSTGLIYLVRQQLFNLGMYAVIFHHFAILSLNPELWWVWIIAFLMRDFCYYWFHRFHHEINILWASHAVHHQSEYFNFVTGLRTQGLGFYFTWIFYVPMALIGFPPLVFASVTIISTLSQFWIHTRHIGKLGWFDRHFASPSNHRVHHAKNPKYLDKNYGAVFMWWDRIFGTFESEDDDYEEIKFGTLTPLKSWNPVWASFHLHFLMVKDSLKTSSYIDKFALWFKRTGYRPKDIASFKKITPVSSYQNFETSVSKVSKIYVVLQFALLLISTIVLLEQYNLIAYWQSVYWFILLCVNLTYIGWILETENRILTYETLRFGITLVGMYFSGLIWHQLPTILWQVSITWMSLSFLSILIAKRMNSRKRTCELSGS